MAKKKKIRADFRKNRQTRARTGDWTRRYEQAPAEHEDAAQGERISGKGELTRKRTVVGEESVKSDATGFGVRLDGDQQGCLRGRVLCVQGLASTVAADDGTLFQCATRRLLRTLSTDQRHVVAAGDRVLFRPADNREGIIERIEPRHGVLSRAVRGRQHVIVANVDQMLIVVSAAEPRLKPNLIDRYLVSAEKGGNPPADLHQQDRPGRTGPHSRRWSGVYSRMGYEVLLVSAKTGFGIDRLRRALAGRETVVAGQSGVGKSSLLNAVDPSLQLRVAQVSEKRKRGGTRRPPPGCCRWPAAATWSIRRASASFSFGT